MTETEIKLARINGVAHKLYRPLVEQYIAERYLPADEIAIIRQRDTKPDEFAEYNDYCENCKMRAKAELGLLTEGENDEAE